MSKQAKRVLIVDDEADLRELLSLSMLRMGVEADLAENVAQAQAFLDANTYGLVLTDMKLPDGNGLEVAAKASAMNNTPVAVITAYGSAENAVAALKAGAFDYIEKPVDLAQLKRMVTQVLTQNGTAEPAAKSERAARPAAADTRGLPPLLGDTPAVAQVRELIGRLARTMAPVAITGESGSGKELAARSIHIQSSRGSGPFVAVNCGAIPENLMEAEFFGYRKGAFTGADSDRNGFFQAASGGTLMLDEVADLPLTMQVKLLRAIQERKVRKVGATSEEPVDVRLISATHKNLPRMVAEGSFRQDLFYRLNVIELRMPALRERRADIPALAEHLLGRIAERHGLKRPKLTRQATERLMEHEFPGNVRELENLLERTVALAGEGVIEADDLGLALSSSNTAQITPAASPSESAPAPVKTDAVALPIDLPAHLDQIERDLIERALAATRYNRTQASTLLGISFRQLRYRMQRLGIQ
ncbi:MAG: sigma-54-dependent transcriptional regulator [Burkholderiaceae bacterium]